MQIRVEKEPYSLAKAAKAYAIICLLYFAVAIAPDVWIYRGNWSDIAFFRWLNLVLIPLVFSLIITRSSRKAHLHLTHLAEPNVIRRRLVQAFQKQGYNIFRNLPLLVVFRSPFFLWDLILGRESIKLKEKKKSVQISGPWVKIHQLEKMAHEGEIFLPSPK
ncbi:hypothetical protein PZB74_14015 [Porifericola rhodea]|uniref:hypothetical protein n=1 Tax=Porifericola rhodea TaxID=930972 RepID=UPI0026671B44|nr:hypothetical protein [Porifericola rhodea]WKN30076.1 hypothetical protein PZB74_14015 [Porifericola rhodea]